MHQSFQIFVVVWLDWKYKSATAIFITLYMMNKNVLDLILHKKNYKKHSKKKTKKCVSVQIFWSLLYIVVFQGIFSCHAINMDVVVVDK